jgi:hypothetical protein
MSEVLSSATPFTVIPFSAQVTGGNTILEQFAGFVPIARSPRITVWRSQASTLTDRRADQSGAVTESKSDATPNAILANWSRLFLAHPSPALYARIVQIARQPNGWRGEGSRALTNEALTACLQFLISVTGQATEPELALTARGTLQAGWFRNSRRHLDIEFVSMEQAFFGLFDRHSVYEGVDEVGAISQWLSAHPSNPLLWRAK